MAPVPMLFLSLPRPVPMLNLSRCCCCCDISGCGRADACPRHCRPPSLTPLTGNGVCDRSTCAPCTPSAQVQARPGSHLSRQERRRSGRESDLFARAQSLYLCIAVPCAPQDERKSQSLSGCPACLARCRRGRCPRPSYPSTPSQQQPLATRVHGLDQGVPRWLHKRYPLPHQSWRSFRRRIWTQPSSELRPRVPASTFPPS